MEERREVEERKVDAEGWRAMTKEKLAKIEESKMTN
jgi:hypothetical protein